MKRISTESPSIRSYRELLGVGPDADLEELKKSYHRLALLYHPDRNPQPTAAAEFQKVREAYDILRDRPRVRIINQRHLRERLYNNVTEGIDISFGSFFGYRVFSGPKNRVPKQLRIGREMTGERDLDEFDQFSGPLEVDNSILDNPAYDAIETVYAGKFSLDDEERLQSSVRGGQFVKLPWVILNNQGILCFLDGDLRGAARRYAELNARIPNNIIFMYRLGLCHILTGFKHPRRTLLGFSKPDSIEIEKGLRLLRHCIKVGETRAVGKQSCLMIRKLLADVLEKTGRRRQALRIWREIQEYAPSSIEALYKTKGQIAARKALKSRPPKTPADRDAGLQNELKRLARGR